MNFHKRVTQNNYIREYVMVLNGLLDLTPREIDVLSTLIKIDESWVNRSTNELKNVTSTDSRRITMKENNMDKSNFTKIIGKLRQMKLLIKNVDCGWVINELLKPKINKDKKIEITFILDLNDAPAVSETI